MLKLVLLGPPGSGKGTQAARLAELTGAAHISTGDLLRAEVAADTELGRQVGRYQARGELVPDDVIVELTLPLVETAGAEHGYLLDGFPRSRGQAERLTAALSPGAQVTRVVLLTVPETELIARMKVRAEREHRVDDTIEVFQHRLAVYQAETAPLAEFFRGRGQLVEVPAEDDAARVFDRIRVALEL